MPELRERLIECFATVFPSLSPVEIPNASITSVPEWDSIATLTLVSVIAEEFHVEFDGAELEQLISFDLILDLLQNKTVES